MMANVFADDDLDHVQPHKPDKDSGEPAQRHNPDATMRSAFKTKNINTGMEERTVQPVRTSRGRK
jgi:hypothetical protein